MHHLISQTTQYLYSWLSDLLHSELKIKLLEVEGARAPVPHSWRRHWIYLNVTVQKTLLIICTLPTALPR